LLTFRWEIFREGTEFHRLAGKWRRFCTKAYSIPAMCVGIQPAAYPNRFSSGTDGINAVARERSSLLANPLFA
jgi:hypothetical protein